MRLAEPESPPGCPGCGDGDTSLENSFVVPDAAPADLSPALRSPAEPTDRAADSPGNRIVSRVPVVKA